MDTFSAADTFVLIDHGKTVFIVSNCVNRTAELTRSLQMCDCIVRTGLRTSSTFFTFCRIDVGAGSSRLNRTEFAGIDTSLSKTVLAVLRNRITGDRTVLTGRADNLNNIPVILRSGRFPLRQPYSLTDNLPLLINTAAQRGRGPGMIFSGMSRIAVPVWSLSSQVRRATSVSTAVFNSWIFVSNVRIVSLFSLPVPFSRFFRWHLLFFPQLLQVFFHFLCHFIATLPPLSIQISNSFPLRVVILNVKGQAPNFGEPSMPSAFIFLYH